MGKDKALKPHNLIRIFVLLSVLLNTAYISFEMYKSKISIGKSELTQSEFSKLDSLSGFAYFFEVSFLFLAVIWTFLMFTKKYNPFLKQSIFIQLSVLIVLFTLNYTIAYIFDAPTGNFTQLLFTPLLLVVGALIYAVLHHLFSRIRRSHRLEN